LEKPSDGVDRENWARRKRATTITATEVKVGALGQSIATTASNGSQNC
jgi:hypothetical protein